MVLLQRGQRLSKSAIFTPFVNENFLRAAASRIRWLASFKALNSKVVDRGGGMGLRRRVIRRLLVFSVTASTGLISHQNFRVGHQVRNCFSSLFRR